MSEQTPSAAGQLSPDGYWWWDGSQWVSAISPDGRWRWDGQRWVVNEVATRFVGPVRNEPTPDTRRVQIAVSSYLVLSAVYTAAFVPQTMQASMRTALRTSPEVDPSFYSGMISAFSIIAIVFAVVWAAVLLLGTWSRWRWVYYLLMILGALGVFSLVSNGLALAGFGTNALVPAWLLATGIVYALLYFGLALWMFLLWRRYRTAWACRAIPI